MSLKSKWANWKLNKLIILSDQQKIIVDKLGYNILWIEECINPEDIDKRCFIIKLADGLGNKAIIKYSINTLEDTIFLADIDNSQMINRGVGSIVLNYLDRRAVEIGASAIYGYLAPTDMDHIPRLERFYHKNGYSIKGTQVIKKYV